jgi:predicted lipid-binding transport protein (Tim44 family)
MLKNIGWSVVAVAGLGLAWLASSLGEGWALWLVGALLAAVSVLVIGARVRHRRADAAAGGLALQAASGHGASQVNPAVAPAYSPKNVGNDASARPWERQTGASVAQPDGALVGASLSGAPGWSIPAGFDVQGFLEASKANFRMLQAAWDRSDIPSLRAMMTDAMLEQIQNQLAERERAASGAANTTDVVMLEAHLLGIEEMDAGYMASVEFSGLIREDLSAGPNPFREVWNITRPKTGSDGWLVAGVQALQ